VFSNIQKILGITIPADATDPKDHLDFTLKRATPMAPVHTQSQTQGATLHDLGSWMPIRRSRIATVAVGGGAANKVTTLDDVEPFKVGDHVGSLDVGGPGGDFDDLGLITAVDYTLNTITTVADAKGLSIDNWIVVLENADVMEVTGNNWGLRTDFNSDNLNPTSVGLLKEVCAMGVNGDVRMQDAEVVVEGRIEDEQVWFNVLPTVDQILLTTLHESASGEITIIQRPHN